MNSQLSRADPQVSQPSFQIIVSLANRCLSEALCRFLRSEDHELQVHQLTDDLSEQVLQILLTDIFSLKAQTHQHCPKARIIVLDEGLDPLQQQKVFEYPSVYGLFQKGSDEQLLIKAIRCVARGEFWIDGATVKSLLNRQRVANLPAGTVHLTRKEGRVLDLVLLGLKNKEIAAEAYLSESTVKVHLSRIYKKFAVENRCQLIAKLTRPETQD